MKFCGGIDLHLNNSVVVVNDAEDRIVLQRRPPNDIGGDPRRPGASRSVRQPAWATGDFPGGTRCERVRWPRTAEMLAISCVIENFYPAPGWQQSAIPHRTTHPMGLV